MMASKTCSKCWVVKPFDEFYGDSRRRDGLGSHCKECRRESVRVYDAANLDKKAAYREANRETARKYASEHHAANPHVHWKTKYRFRAVELGFPLVIEDFTRADVIAAYGDACVHCGGVFEHLDHYPVPVAHGGTHTLENVRPSCAACNLSLGTRVRRATSSPSR